MALTQGAFRTYDFNRMVVVFTMMNGETEVACAVTTSAMDDLESPFKATAEQREAQFLRLRERIEQRVAQEFLKAGVGGKRSEIVLRSIDFSSKSSVR